MAAAATPNKIRALTGRGRVRGERAFYASQSLDAASVDDGSVIVSFSLAQNPRNLVILKDAIAAVAPKGAQMKEGVLATVLEKVGERFLRAAFSTEFDKLISEYRVMLRENLAKADDAPLKAALNRARIQERILASTQMADQSEACELLGLSGSNPSATMKRKEEKNGLLRFTIDGRAAYPLLQFDVENRRIYPALSEIIARRPDDWSNFRLLHWLTREHLDFDDTPAAALGREAEAVIAAFERAIEPEVHG
ncbi:hypothetical protein [Sphingobium yanoikuyae]|uniref:Uncharacterized protein n=1 Tax=Sphingobium yanoikuyae TaxID=13690 RepID=A0A291MZK7_SPHYA|nr:hypothetical protein [Sphingobium yanoikuyae]ATI80594.1 hypothetical protein A6768_11710 [Sphingobium yanoikuyae]